MNFLEQIAPTIATAVGGPLAGLAYEAISKVMGISSDDAKKVLDSGKLSGDQLAQVQVAEIELKKQAQALGLDFERLSVEDRDSARKLQIATGSRLVPAIAIMIIGSFIASVLCVLFGWAKVEGAVAGAMVGYLSAKAEQVTSFLFGSSAGSAKKTDALVDQLSAKVSQGISQQ